MEMMVDMARKNHQTLIVVTHDEEIAEYADRIFHIKDGKIDNTFKNLAKDKRLAQEAQYGQYIRQIMKSSRMSARTKSLKTSRRLKTCRL